MGALTKIARSIIPDIALDVVGSFSQYRREHGAIPNILFPKTFNEKVIRRSLFDTRPILRQFADKYAVRSYVAEKLGVEILPQLYWVTDTPANIPFDRLPNRFVVKPTHGAGWVRIVRDKARLDRCELLKQCQHWLSQNFYKRHHERVYKDIPPRIIVEELVDDGTEGAPIDYKLMVFHGRVEIIAAIFNRFKAPYGFFLDREWNILDARLEIDGPVANDALKTPSVPKHLPEMIRAAEILADGMDFVRADFYDTPEKIYFGELTTTPGAGLAKYDPPSFDEYLGAFW